MEFLNEVINHIESRESLHFLLFLVSVFVSSKILNLIFFDFAIKKLESASKLRISKQNQAFTPAKRLFNFIILILSISFLQGFFKIDPFIIKIIDNIQNALAIFALFYSIAYLILPYAFDYIFKNISSQSAKSQKSFILTIFKVLLIILAVLSIMQSFGVNVSALLAGLTITSTAIAFGSQDVIKNFFGSLAILFDNTYKPGDWIKGPNVEGVVEKISLRTTTIRQFDKALVTIPNDKLANVALINYSQMTQRRILWNIGIDYNVTNEQLKTIVNGLRAYLEKNVDIESDPNKVTTLINADKFDDSAINIFCYFFTKTTNWKEYMDIKEKCLFDFREIIQNAGGTIAYPVMEVVKREG